MAYHYKVGVIVPFLQKYFKQITIAVAAIFIASMAMMTLTAKAATNSVVTTDLGTWDLSQTRSAGFQEITTSGLRVWTTDNTSQAKAAGYYNSDDFDLENASDWELVWTGTSPAPGGQLVVDLDADGDIDGILVVEGAYGGIGGNLWLPSLYDAASTNAGLVASLPNVPGGGGPNNGSLNTWNTNFPNAKVLAIGYSLGSGILGDGIISRITVNDTDYTFELPAPTPALVAEEFVTVDGSYKGISVGFRTTNFTDIVAVDVVLERADGSTVTKTGNQGVLDLVNQPGPTQLTAPFVIQEGAFTEASDTFYWDPAPAVWNESTKPVRVTITLTDSEGIETSVTNEMFNEGEPSWPTYISLLPQPKVLASKDECKNNGWVFATANGFSGTFKNQGQCVSYFASSAKSTNARNR